MNALAMRPTLETRDVARSMAFYRAALGFEALAVMEDPPVFALLANGPAWLGLAQTEHPAVAGVVAAYLDVDDVEGAHAQCAGADVQIVQPCTTHPWGMRDFVIVDPDGHRVAVGQRLAERG